MSKVKYKYIFSIFLAGVVVNFFGGLKKILHSPNANFILSVAFCIMALSIVLLIIKLLLQKRENSFLDK
jgi:hypothetical protein